MISPPPTLPHQWLDAAVELMGQSGRSGSVRVQGRSMWPTLEEGWLLAVEFSPGVLRRGDLLVFRREDFLVVHRLLGSHRGSAIEESLRTRGDGFPYLDPPVSRASVVGRAFALYDGRDWRDLRSRGARVYASLVASHDRCWALATYGARRVSAALARVGPELSLERASAACDRSLLRLVHGLAFRALHPRIPAPLEAGPD